MRGSISLSNRMSVCINSSRKARQNFLILTLEYVRAFVDTSVTSQLLAFRGHLVRDEMTHTFHVQYTFSIRLKFYETNKLQPS